ncbi:hypothetical protein QU481_22550 [Crenobacter sp. SG2303]|uniref:Transposase n=1 Tax=Crenobacter oryzisoli TaxID=3056844 RepID=A0ABT7XV47_9NEIS|nr:hypothetical protein [Crenobacter sp. SG2303]MDN0077605.1 hypothetical protein [Crenobacter sp. SG2303]
MDIHHVTNVFLHDLSSKYERHNSPGKKSGLKNHPIKRTMQGQAAKSGPDRRKPRSTSRQKTHKPMIFLRILTHHDESNTGTANTPLHGDSADNI